MFSANKTVTISDEQAMREVMALMDDWKAPEPTPWFDARMMARFREEQTKEPESLFARLRDRWLFSSPRLMKPLMAGSMAALVLAVGSGGYLQMSHKNVAPLPSTMSATVEDLQILNNNDQLIQQMDQLLDDDDSPQS